MPPATVPTPGMIALPIAAPVPAAAILGPTPASCAPDSITRSPVVGVRPLIWLLMSGLATRTASVTKGAAWPSLPRTPVAGGGDCIGWYLHHGVPPMGEVAPAGIWLCPRVNLCPAPWVAPVDDPEAAAGAGDPAAPAGDGDAGDGEPPVTPAAGGAAGGGVTPAGGGAGLAFMLSTKACVCAGLTVCGLTLTSGLGVVRGALAGTGPPRMLSAYAVADGDGPEGFARILSAYAFCRRESSVTSRNWPSIAGR